MELLGESPIQKKKLKYDSCIIEKAAKVSLTLERTFATEHEPINNAHSLTLDQQNTHDLNHIVHQLKEKFHHQDTTTGKKIQILTILPLRWSTKKVSETMNATEYIVKAAKKTGARKKNTSGTQCEIRLETILFEIDGMLECTAG